ncbi:E3 ubiquitin-protein ligase E3D isoform X2 [Ascaphus truei]|uniref:E3 ubiquitin-protein ligase E3D isoform X2 n=1 Tax=Ascaphus truei TaxID=8439 RepID=UPI003F5A5357
MESTVLLEIRKMMQSGILILGGVEDRRFPVDVSVSPSALQIQTPEHRERVRLPEAVRLVPSSCRGLQHVSGEGLHMRLQVWADCNTKMVSALHGILKVNKNYTFYCQSCGEFITKEQQFLRVLPLPSENWSSLVGEWCCHADPFANRNCQPKVNDCFLGDSFLLLNRANISEPTAETNTSSSVSCSAGVNVSRSKENTKVICKRCKAILGETVSSDAVKYYITEVMIQPSCDDFNMIPRTRYVESVIAQHLVEFSASRSTFRFCIQGQDGKVFLLLWLLNTDTLLVESARRSENGLASLFFENISCLPAVSLEARNAIKVLYHACIDNSKKERIFNLTTLTMIYHNRLLKIAWNNEQHEFPNFLKAKRVSRSSNCKACG